MRSYCKVDHENGTKQCADCQTVKPLGEFPVRKTGYVYAYCNLCNCRRAREWSAKNRERKAESGRQWALKNPERSREIARTAHYKRRYGVSYEEVLSSLAKQDFRCGICKKEIDEKSLVVDHCHGSNIIRGILCNLCNISLAPIERPGFLHAAISYLESHRSKS